MHTSRIVPSRLVWNYYCSLVSFLTTRANRATLINNNISWVTSHDGHIFQVQAYNFTAANKCFSNTSAVSAVHVMRPNLFMLFYSRKKKVRLQLLNAFYVYNVKCHAMMECTFRIHTPQTLGPLSSFSD